VFLTLLVVFPAHSRASKPTDTIVIAAQSQPKAVIVIGKDASETHQFAATELQRYLRALSGAEVSVVTDDQRATRPRGETAILLGGPEENSAVRDVTTAHWVDYANLKSDGIVIKAGLFKGRPTIIAGGANGVATMYAVYDLLEQLGIKFLLTGDIIPPPVATLSVPALNLRKEPSFARRGFLLQSGGMINLMVFSFEDYVKLLDQMAKMKANYLQFWWFSYEPWLKYSYKGESMQLGDVSKKESGFFSWAHVGSGPHTPDVVEIGKEHFKTPRLAPKEFQKVETSEQAFGVAQDLLQRVIRHAAKRGIKVWPAVELAALPPNLARHAERVGELPFHTIFGTFVHPLDEVNREIQVERLKALISTYPEAEGFFLVFAEMYPNLNNQKHREFFTRERPKFHELRDLRRPWINWGEANSDDNLVDSNLAYLDLFQFLLKKRDEISPKTKLGVMGIGRGYALPVFDRMLPRDIPFTDMDSSGVWTPTAVPMNYFGGMGERERTLEPRVDDDINMMGMQFNVTQYAVKDKIFSDGVKVGLTGHAGQLNRVRGLEANAAFLTEAAWAPELTPEEFYKNYSRSIFGEFAAADMLKAFLVLEKNELHLGYYNYGYTTMNCCGALPEVSIAYEYWQQANPFDGPTMANWDTYIAKSPDVINRFEGSIQLLNQSLDSMKAAQARVAPQGAAELRYMINRTESYRDLIQSLITMRKAQVSFAQSFQTRTKVPYAEFVKNLERDLGEFERAGREMRSATRKYAELIDHPSDLGVLYSMNARGIVGFDLVAGMIRNVVRFHQGKPYLEHVPFEKLYSTDVHIAVPK
jgi:hypothetical protein